MAYHKLRPIPADYRIKIALVRSAISMAENTNRISDSTNNKNQKEKSK